MPDGRGALVIRAGSIGPLDAETSATLVGLRARLAGYQVRPVNDDSLEYDVLLDGEKLAFVVPERGKIFNVHAVSPKVTVEGRDWRVGHPFHDSARLTNCECWGDNPTCFKRGEHVAVNFARDCDNLEQGNRRALRVLDGLLVQRVIWSPRPFGDDDDGDGGDED